MTLAFAPLPCPDSPLRRLDARWKLAGLGLTMFAVALLRSPATAGVALACALALAWFGRLPARWFLVRLGTVLMMVSPLVLTLPLLVPGDSWRTGVELALTMAAKVAALVTVALVLLTSAPLTDTFKAAHALRVPGLLVQLFALSYRYAFLVAGELGRLRLALRARGFKARPTAHGYRTVGHVAGTLLVRSHERGERVAQAMRCRGFDGRYRSLSESHTGAADVFFFAALAALAAGLVFWDLSLRGSPHG
jgi:cobalt/nickel transport system permease protein